MARVRRTGVRHAASSQLEVLRIINEPTAGAIAYGRDNVMRSGFFRVLVCVCVCVCVCLFPPSRARFLRPLPGHNRAENRFLSHLRSALE